MINTLTSTMINGDENGKQRIHRADHDANMVNCDPHVKQHVETDEVLR